jgi:predicted esterase
MHRRSVVLLLLAIGSCQKEPSSPAIGAGGEGGGGGSAGAAGSGGAAAGGGGAMQPQGGTPAGGVMAGRDGKDGSTTGGDAAAAGPASSRQTARRLGTTAAAQGFFEYLPPGYGDGRKFPLLVFMHGVGENGNGGTDLDRVLNNGPPRLIRQNRWPADRPFIVLSPQQRMGCPSAANVDAFLTFALGNYDVDEQRVYLTGLSCGGIGTWNYLARHQGERVAAVAIVAGDGRSAFRTAGCALGQVAIWAFHGDQDPTVPVAGATETIASLMTCPSPPRKEVKLNIYPGVGHDSWTRTYDLTAGHDIYNWLLSFTH